MICRVMHLCYVSKYPCNLAHKLPGQLSIVITHQIVMVIGFKIEILAGQADVGFLGAG